MDRAISVIIPHRNECKAEVEATARSFKHAGAGEIILVYDKDGRGPAWARNEGARRATGDSLCFTDAHCRWHDGDFHHFALLGLHCIMVAPCSDYEDPAGRVAYGADLVEDPEKPGYALLPIYRPRARAQALYGSVYAMSRQVYQDLGGWPQTISWGYNEQAMSLAAKWQGISIMVDAGCRILHKFRERFPYPVGAHDPLVNRMIAHKRFSDPREWAEYWQPRFEEHKAAWAKFCRLNGDDNANQD